MRCLAIKYGEYFQGQITLCREKRGLYVNFENCTDLEKQEWCIYIEPNTVMNTGDVFELEEGVLCEIVSKNSSRHYVRFLKPETRCISEWINKNIASTAPNLMAPQDKIAE